VSDTSPKPEKSFIIAPFYRSYVLFILLIIAIFNYADRYMLGVLMPAIKTDLGLSDTQIGFISGAAFTILYAFLGVPIARLADKYSRKKIISIALAVWSTMTFLCGLAQSFAQFAIFRVLLGIGEAGCTPPSHSIISDYYHPTKRTSALAIFGLGSPIGVFIGFLFGGLIAETMGWRVALFIFGLPGILVALITYITVKDPPRGFSENYSNTKQLESEQQSLWSNFLELWKKGTFRHMVLGGSMYGIIMVSILIWIPSFFVRTHDLNLAEVGTWLAFTNGIPHAFGTLAGGLIADRLTKINLRAPIFLCVFAQVAASPFYAFVLLWPNSTGAFLWLIIPSFVGVMQGPVLFATIQAVSDIRHRAVAAALMILIINLISGVIGPQIVGLISDLTMNALGENSLRLALLIITITCSLWSAFHFYLASQNIEDDLK